MEARRSLKTPVRMRETLVLLLSTRVESTGPLWRRAGDGRAGLPRSGAGDSCQTEHIKARSPGDGQGWWWAFFFLSMANHVVVPVALAWSQRGGQLLISGIGVQRALSRPCHTALGFVCIQSSTFLLLTPGMCVLEMSHFLLSGLLRASPHRGPGVAPSTPSQLLFCFLSSQAGTRCDPNPGRLCH